MKLILGLFGLLLLIVIVGTYSQGFVQNKFKLGTQTTVTIDNQTFTVDTAKTEADQEQGLSGRQSLAKDHGMLFIFNKPDIYRFWMKDMKFPLDIIYIKNDKITTILDNLQNPSSPSDYLPVYQPDQPSDRVLEINAGLARKNNFKVNDTVTYKNL